MKLAAATPDPRTTGVEVSLTLELPRQRFSPRAERTFDVLLAMVLFLELIGIDKLPDSWRKYVECARHYFAIVVALIGLRYALPMWQDAWTNLTVVLQIPKSWTLLPFFIGMGLTVVFALAELRRHTVKENIVAAWGIAALALIWFLAYNFTGPWLGTAGIGFALVLLLFLVFVGVPIACVLSVTAYVFLYSSGEKPMAVSLAMSNGISSFVLLAVPFFILAGNVMTDGGLTKPLADWVTAMIGRMRGGLLQALVIAMYISSGTSGSKIADVAAVGTTLESMLKDQCYDPAESGAVLCWLPPESWARPFRLAW